LFIDYGQYARNLERNSATRIANYYNIPFDQACFSASISFGQGEIQGRNAFFIMAALLVYPKYKGILSIGIHTGTPYYDCSEQFMKDITNILDAYTGGAVRVDAPFLTWNKAMIYSYCKEKEVPINLTYSCQAGTDPPCGKCDSCKDREALDAS
jgi:7-cyano-7-deazaguanine synthase